MQYAQWTTVTCFYIAAKKEQVKEASNIIYIHDSRGHTC